MNGAKKYALVYYDYICNIMGLVTAEARYHSACVKKFCQTSSHTKRGRPKSSTVFYAMSHAFNYLEEN